MCSPDTKINFSFFYGSREPNWAPAFEFLETWSRRTGASKLPEPELKFKKRIRLCYPAFKCRVGILRHTPHPHVPLDSFFQRKKNFFLEAKFSTF